VARSVAIPEHSSGPEHQGQEGKQTQHGRGDGVRIQLGQAFSQLLIQQASLAGQDEILVGQIL